MEVFFLFVCANVFITSKVLPNTEPNLPAINPATNLSPMEASGLFSLMTSRPNLMDVYDNLRLYENGMSFHNASKPSLVRIDRSIFIKIILFRI